jgi:hypothetical protein
MGQARHLMRPDPRDPDFDRKALAWAFQARCEIHELTLATTKMIDATRALIAEADRMLAEMM